MEYVARLLGRELRAFIDEPEPNTSVLLVEGGRQVGKSFLVAPALGRSTCWSASRTSRRKGELVP